MRFFFPSLFLLFLWATASPAQTFTVTFLHTPPSSAVEGRPIDIYGTIVGADQVSIAALAYRRPGSEEYEVAELKLDAAERYRGRIPASVVTPPGVEYYCYAVDFEGNQQVIFASAAQPQFVPVVSRDEAAKRTGVKLEKKARKEKTQVEKTQILFSPPPARHSEIATLRQNLAEEKVLRAVAVVGRDEIERAGYRTLAEILDATSGITVSRTVRGDYLLAVRGLAASSALLVLLDGRRMNEPWNGMSWLEFPAAVIEKVEILRGPAAGLYGAGAMAGVILVHTINDRRLRAEGGSGSYFDSRVSAGGGLKAGNLDLNGQLSFVYSDGYRRLVESDIFSGVESNDPALDVSNTPGYTEDQRLQFFSRINGTLNELPGASRLAWRAQYFFQQRGPLVGKLNSLDSGSRIDRHWLLADIDYDWRISEKLLLESNGWFDLRLGQDRFQLISVDDNKAKYVVHTGGQNLVLEDGLSESYRHTLYQTGGRLGMFWEMSGGNRIATRASVEYLLLDEFVENRSTGKVACPAGGLPFQGYLLPCGEYRGPASGKDRLLVGVQLADDWQDLLDTGVDLHAAFRLDWATDYGLALAPQLAVGFWPWERLGLKTSYGMSYRAPHLEELYGDNVFDPMGTVGGNSALKPVVAHEWDAGLVSLWPSELARVRINLDFFMNWIQDNIVGLDTGQGLPAYANRESLVGLGLETGLEANFGRRSRINANASWFRLKSKLPGRPQSSYITDVPQLRLNLEAQLELASWLDLTLELRCGSERRNNVRLPLETLHGYTLPAWTMLGAGLVTRPIFWDSLSFFVQARNILQQDVRDPAPRPEQLPGMVPREPFIIFGGVRWQEAPPDAQKE